MKTMANHPNRKPTPYKVMSYPGDQLAMCRTEHEAQLIARLWSRHWGGWTEVYNMRKDEAGLVGQWEGGKPLAEFAHLDSVPGLRLRNI